MMKLLITLCRLTILVSLFLPGSISQANDEVDHSVSAADIVAQTLADVKSFNCNDAADVPASECQALVDLYESTNGAGWTNSDNWLESNSISSWYGLLILDNHVNSIILESNNLSGFIPDSISFLPFLVEICFVNNHLTGPIPESIGQLTNLTRLSLGINELTGTIPASLGAIPNLFKLTVDNNNLTGSMPETLGDLASLYRLEVHHNQLSGALPESLGQLSNLEIMVLSNNDFSGAIPISFTKLSNLDYFYFMFTDLCEPATKEYLLWKTTVFEYHGTDLICMDFHCFMPIIFR